MPPINIREAENKETYLYGQGRVYYAPITNGVLGKWRWLLDVSEFTFSPEMEKLEHKESYSGQKATARSFIVGKTLNYSMTLHNINAGNLALALGGSNTFTEAGTVTGEVLPEVEPGDIIRLANMGVSNVVLTDASSAALDPKYYTVAENYGRIDIIDLPTPAPTQPFTAAYSYGKSVSTAMFKTLSQDIAIMYEGINLAESGAPIGVEFYKCSSDILNELALIQNDTNLAGMQLSGSVLIDSNKPADGALGQFGRIIQLL